MTSLLDNHGYFHRDAIDAARAMPDEVEMELSEQVRWAKRLVLRPSRLDAHMGVIYYGPESLRSYIKVSLENDIILMILRPTEEIISQAREIGMQVSDEVMKEILGACLPMLDNLITETYDSYFDEKIKWFRKTMKAIEPGTINQLIVHLGTDSDELRAIMPRHIERYLDYKLVMSAEARKAVEEFNIILIGWEDLKKIWRK